MDPQPAAAPGITPRDRTIVWAAVTVGAVAALAQVLLEWRFDLRAEQLVDEHTTKLLRSRVTDSVVIWSALPTVYYLARLALWVCALLPTLAAAKTALGGSRAGRITLLVLAGVFAVVSGGYGVLYTIAMRLRVDEVYGDEIAYPTWLSQLAGAAGGLAAVAAVALLVVLAKPPFVRPKQPVKLGIREGE